MKTESETRTLVEEYLELWFGRIHGNIAALIFRRNDAEPYCDLHIINPGGFSKEDDKVITAMEHFYMLVSKSAFSKEYPSPFPNPSETEERVIFRFRFNDQKRMSECPDQSNTN